MADPAPALTRTDKAVGAASAVLTLGGLFALAWLEPLSGLPVERVIPILGVASLVLGGVLAVASFLTRGNGPPKKGSLAHVMRVTLSAVFLSCFGGTFTLLLLGYGGPPSVTVNGVPVEHGVLSQWGLRLVGWPLIFPLDWLAVLCWLEALRSLAHVFFEFPDAKGASPAP